MLLTFKKPKKNENLFFLNFFNEMVNNLLIVSLYRNF